MTRGIAEKIAGTAVRPGESFRSTSRRERREAARQQAREAKDSRRR